MPYSHTILKYLKTVQTYGTTDRDTEQRSESLLDFSGIFLEKSISIAKFQFSYFRNFGLIILVFYWSNTMKSTQDNLNFLIYKSASFTWKFSSKVVMMQKRILTF